MDHNDDVTDLEVSKAQKILYVYMTQMFYPFININDTKTLFLFPGTEQENYSHLKNNLQCDFKNWIKLRF